MLQFWLNLKIGNFDALKHYDSTEVDCWNRNCDIFLFYLDIWLFPTIILRPLIQFIIIWCPFNMNREFYANQEILPHLNGLFSVSRRGPSKHFFMCSSLILYQFYRTFFLEVQLLLLKQLSGQHLSKYNIVIRVDAAGVIEVKKKYIQSLFIKTLLNQMPCLHCDFFIPLNYNGFVQLNEYASRCSII